VASVVFNFGYLAFFRMAGYLGFEEVSTGTPNAVQLVLSLKVRSSNYTDVQYQTTCKPNIFLDSVAKGL